jgi:hypothetical protein
MPRRWQDVSRKCWPRSRHGETETTLCAGEECIFGSPEECHANSRWRPCRDLVAKHHRDKRSARLRVGSRILARNAAVLPCGKATTGGASSNSIGLFFARTVTKPLATPPRPMHDPSLVWPDIRLKADSGATEIAVRGPWARRAPSDTAKRDTTNNRGGDIAAIPDWQHVCGLVRLCLGTAVDTSNSR